MRNAANVIGLLGGTLSGTLPFPQRSLESYLTEQMFGPGRRAVAGAGSTTSAANTIKGNNTGSMSATIDLTIAQVNTMLGDVLANGSVAFTADQSMGSHKLTNVTDPASAQDAATKNYVDLAVATLATKADCQAATTTGLAAYTYNNGSAGVGATITLTVSAVLVLDGYTPALNDRLLIKNETSSNAPYNGIYTLTTVGVLGVTQAVLTRATDFNQPSDGINGALTFILNGTVNGNTLWSCTTDATIVFGTTNINWFQFQGTTYTADETTLHLTGTTFSEKDGGTTNAKLANMANHTIKARDTAGTGVPEDKGISTVLDWLSATAGANLYRSSSAWAAATISNGQVGEMVSGVLTSTPVFNSVFNFRLSLATATPIPTADLSAQSTIYLCQFGGNLMGLYDGTQWRIVASAELNISLSSLVTYQAYDLFVDWNSGTPQLQKAEWANATVTVTIASPCVVTWTGHGMSTGNAITFTTTGALPTGITANTQYFVTVIDANTFKLSTTRTNLASSTFVSTSGSQSGTHTGHQPQARQTALVLQDGILVKSGTLTSRYCGTFVADGTSTTSTVFGGTSNQAGGKWLVWNCYNQQPFWLFVWDSTASWSGSNAGNWQCLHTTEANRVECVLGLAGNPIEADVSLLGSGSSGAGGPGVGVDTTSALPSTPTPLHNEANVSTSPQPATCNWAGRPGIGWHALYALEYARATPVTFYGSGGVADVQSGMRVEILA